MKLSKIDVAHSRDVLILHVPIDAIKRWDRITRHRFTAAMSGVLGELESQALSDRIDSELMAIIAGKSSC